jgi:hypothetical protein
MAQKNYDFIAQLITFNPPLRLQILLSHISEKMGAKCISNIQGNLELNLHMPLDINKR